MPQEPGREAPIARTGLACVIAPKSLQLLVRGGVINVDVIRVHA